MIDNGDGTFSGFMVDLLDGLAKKDGFSYEISLNPDGKYGIKQNGQWTGMIGELLDTVSISPIVIGKLLDTVSISPIVNGTI